MFSKVLIKLIDQAIVPALVIFASKIISTIVVAKYFGVSFTLGSAGFIYSNTKDYLLVNSYSTFCMVAILALGLFYILLKSLVFHSSHITPSLTAKLFSLRLSAFIQDSFDLYSQGTVWISYSYLMLLITLVMFLFGSLYAWVFISALVVTVTATVLFVLDIENELGAAVKKGSVDEEELVLRFEGGSNE